MLKSTGAVHGMLMGSAEDSIRLSVRGETERFLATHGFSAPPLPSDQALAARKLAVSQFSLDDLLLRANLPPEDHKKIQAMLDADARTVAFKRGLPAKKKDWGSLHEVAHEFIPWQRDLLYYCPLLWLPAHLQAQFEAEAELFAAEAFFFGRRFHKQAYSGELSLSTAIELASNLYGTSFHATFAHYVEESPLPRCLLVWRPHARNGSTEASTGLELHYYLKSRSFLGHIEPGQIADPDGAISTLFTALRPVVTRHEMVFQAASGEERVVDAESFSNSYNVFTLISQPMSRSTHSAPARNGPPHESGTAR